MKEEYSDLNLDSLISKFKKCSGENAVTCPPSLLESVVNSIQENYGTKAQHVIDETPELQRDRLVGWIRNPKVKVLIMFSGGKDSVAMALHLHFNLKIKASRIQLWHHEIDGIHTEEDGTVVGEQLFDWKGTVSYCQAFADHFGFEILYSYRKGGIVREIFRENETRQNVFYQSEPGGEYHELKSVQSPDYMSTRHKFPAISADLRTRWCSSTVKIDVASQAINNMPSLKTADIVVCTGERWVESRARENYLEVEVYRSKTLKRNRKVITWRPVIDWSHQEIWDILEKHKVQPHPSYELGWGRCSCQTCIFNSPDTWATLKEIQPEKIVRLTEIEKEINFTLHTVKRSKTFKLTEDQIVLFKTHVDALESGNPSPLDLESSDAKAMVMLGVFSKGINSLEVSEDVKLVERKRKSENGVDKYFRVVLFWWEHHNIDEIIEGKNKVRGGKPTSFMTPEIKEKWLSQAIDKFTMPIIVEGEWKMPLGASSSESCGAT